MRHPIFKNKNTVLVYLAAWIPLGFMFRLTLAFAAHLSHAESFAVTIPVVILMAIVCLWPWYLCRVLPLTSPLNALIGHAIVAMLVSAAASAIVHVFAAMLSRLFPGLDVRIGAAMPVLAGTLFLTYLLATALHYVVLAVEASRQAELLSREAQLKALKAQVNPHFLFNSLNSISALTTVDPSRARDMCIRLSDFLRNSLRLGERVSIPFGEELVLAGNYLSVEQIRFGERLKVKQDFDEQCKDCEVPPLLFQPLIENAIKHGIATLVEGGEIGIAGRRLKDTVKVVVENPFDPDAPACEKSGFGLINVRNRLQARYGSGARLDIEVERNLYRVILSFPCGRGKGAHS
jgi:two-component system, LytTR family, sensor histidine kinase AlgZ